MHFTLFFLILKKYVINIYDNEYILNAVVMLMLLFSFLYLAWKSTHVPIKVNFIYLSLLSQKCSHINYYYLNFTNNKYTLSSPQKI